MKYCNIFFCLATLLTLQSCFHHWTEKEKEEFKLKCSQTDTLTSLSFSMTGYNFDEIDTILVRELNDGKIIDTFSIFINQASFDRTRNRYSGNIERPMPLKHTYQFVVDGRPVHEIKNMKMMMWAQWTMNSEGYGCVMGDYIIDTTRYEHNANPDFIKATNHDKAFFNFDSSKWKNGDRKIRGEMVDKMISDSILIGKSKSDVLQLLGSPTASDLTSPFVYEVELGKKTGPLGLGGTWLFFMTVQFDTTTNKVNDVWCRD